jgi:hypothetical protein
MQPISNEFDECIANPPWSIESSLSHVASSIEHHNSTFDTALNAGQCCNSCNNQLNQQTQLQERPPALYAGLSQVLQRSLLQPSVAAVAAVISRVNSGTCK